MCSQLDFVLPYVVTNFLYLMDFETPTTNFFDESFVTTMDSTQLKLVRSLVESLQFGP